MWQAAVLNIVVLFSATLADGQSTCDSDAPYNCTFKTDLRSCNWTFDSSWTYDNSSAVFGTDNSTGVNVKSRTACSTGNDKHCLQIRYLFEGKNISMKVLLGEQIVCDVTDSKIGVWHTASIPIQSMDNFNITIEARKIPHIIGKIFISHIHYIKAPCSPVSTDASDVGLVVGIMVAVIVIVVAVFIFILYRLKRLYLWKTCFINKNKKDTTGTPQNGESSVGKHDRHTVHSVNEKPTVLGINNHAFIPSGLLSSDTYSSVIKDTDGSGDSANPHYSTIQESKSAHGKTPTTSSKGTDDDPNEIMAESGHLTSRSTATRHAIANDNLKSKTGLNSDPFSPSSNGGNRHASSDYSLARDTEGEATGVYHCLEEDPNNHGEEGATGLYHYATDPGINPDASADATGVYHILEEDPAITRGNQSDGVYQWPIHENMGQQNTSTVKVSKRQTGNYNTLDLAGNNSGQKIHEDASGGVYNHLNAESDDPYNEVDREKRAEVIDGEYSHIK